MARERKARDHAGSRVPPARPRVGKRGAGGHHSRGARACGVAARAMADGTSCRRWRSDAYATGQALYALNVAGKMAVSSPVYQKGVDYLLRTQAPDGTWHVETRAIWLQPYFESGFPYGRDQFISAAGTAWAVMALTPAAQTQRFITAR